MKPPISWALPVIDMIASKRASSKMRFIDVIPGAIDIHILVTKRS
jgi:hypothetical protein